MYAKARPGYPAEAIDFIISRLNLVPGTKVADIGCGTGISSRLLAARGLKVIGIEPNEDMIKKARSAEDAPSVGRDGSADDVESEDDALSARVAEIEYRQANAEQTGLPDRWVDAVTCAQAFHWFDPEAALTEFHRILKDHGWVALIWNVRNNKDDFTRGYGDAFKQVAPTADDAGRLPRNRDYLLSHPMFEDGRADIFANEQTLERDSLIARAFSASYAPREGPGADLLKKLLDELFDRYQSDGAVRIKYDTCVYTARQRTPD